MKTCTKCGAVKDLSFFSKDKYKKSGYKSSCKLCNPDKRTSEQMRIKSQEYRNKLREQNPDKLKSTWRNSKLKRAYGISIEDYTEMLIKQSYRCAVCGIHSDDSGHHGKLVVDHCHNTGKVRSLLCSKCNTALGLLNEDTSIMESLIAYVEAHK